MMSLSKMYSTATLLLLLSSAYSLPSQDSIVPPNEVSLETRNDANHPSLDRWPCSPASKKDTTCVNLQSTSTPSWISPPQIFPGYASCVDACWYDAYHVKARQRIQYKGEANSTATDMVAGRYALMSNSYYYETTTHRRGIWRSAKKNGDGKWLYTKYHYEGPDDDLELRFDEFTSADSLVEIQQGWIDWDHPFAQRSPVQAIEAYGILAGSAFGFLEAGSGLMVNPFY